MHYGQAIHHDLRDSEFIELYGLKDVRLPPGRCFTKNIFSLNLKAAYFLKNLNYSDSRWKNQELLVKKKTVSTKSVLCKRK